MALSKIIEESFAQKVGTGLIGAGGTLAGAGLGATFGYDMDPNDYNEIQGPDGEIDYEYSPELARDIAAGAVVGSMLGPMAYNRHKNDSTAKALAYGAGAAGLGAVSLARAEEIPGMEILPDGIGPEINGAIDNGLGYIDSAAADLAQRFQ